MMQSERLRPYFLMIVLAAAIVLTALIFSPFFKPLSLAAVFAVVLQGLYKRISKLIGGWPSVAALLTVVVSVVLILLPLSLVGVLVGNEAREMYFSLEESGGQSTISQLFLRIDESFCGAIPGLGAFAGDIPANVDTNTKQA